MVQQVISLGNEPLRHQDGSGVASKLSVARPSAAFLGFCWIRPPNATPRLLLLVILLFFGMRRQLDQVEWLPAVTVPAEFVPVWTNTPVMKLPSSSRSIGLSNEPSTRSFQLSATVTSVVVA